MIYVKGDITEAKVQCIGHGCNCFHTMGSGVALAIKNKWPEALIADLQTKYGDTSKMGGFSSVILDDEEAPHILNNYSQYRYGRERRQLDYEAQYLCLQGNLKYMLENSLNSIAYPKFMGCMNAGGDWRIVLAMIEAVFDNQGVDVFIYEL